MELLKKVSGDEQVSQVMWGGSKEILDEKEDVGKG